MPDITVIKEILGLTPVAIWQEDDDEIHFRFSDNSVFRFHHRQDCCESVYIDDVNGEWDDLIGSPIFTAEERIDVQEDKSDYESSTWSFYTFRGIGGSVDVKWVGESNGYYSETVDYGFVKKGLQHEHI